MLYLFGDDAVNEVIYFDFKSLSAKAKLLVGDYWLPYLKYIIGMSLNYHKSHFLRFNATQWQIQTFVKESQNEVGVLQCR